MARPTAAKFVKMSADLEKLRMRLLKEAGTITTARGNPIGSDMQICKDLEPVESLLREAASLLREADSKLAGPLRILVNRKKDRT